MEIHISTLILQSSLALVALGLAINSRGSVRQSLNGVIAVLVIGATIVLFVLGGRSPVLQAELSDQEQLAVTAVRTNDEMAERHAQALRDSLAVAQRSPQEQVRLAEATARERARTDYLTGAKPEVAGARDVVTALLSFSTSDLTTLSDADRQARQRDAQILQDQANTAFTGLKGLEVPADMRLTQLQLSKAADCLRRAGVALTGSVESPDAAASAALAEKMRLEANAADKALDEFKRITETP
jgi:hypothetical protein